MSPTPQIINLTIKSVAKSDYRKLRVNKMAKSPCMMNKPFDTVNRKPNLYNNSVDPDSKGMA